MRYSIPNKTNEKAIRANQACKNPLAHRPKGFLKKSGNRLDKKYKTREIIKSGIKSLPVIKWTNSITQRNNSIIALKKVAVVPSVAHKGITNIREIRQGSLLNIFISYPIFEKILTYISKFERLLTKIAIEFLAAFLITFLISEASFATDFTKQANDLVQASHGMRDSQMNEIHQFLENIHNPSPETIPSSPSNEIAQQDSQKDAWGEAPLSEFTTPPAIKSVPDQKEGDTCCRAPNNLELTEIQHSFKESTSQKEGELLIFVSFSLPDQALKNLYEESRRLNARVILRGLHKNSFQEARKKAQDLGIQADIDPTLFEKHAVKVIPTFVLERKDQADKVSGNISAQEALGILQGELE